MGSGGAGRAQRAAEETEARRQAQVSATTGRINAIFDSPQRQQQYMDLGDALMGYFRQDADRQQAVADRNLRFSLARSGLTGGTAAADAGAQQRGEYLRGLLGGSQRAQGAVADLRGQDATTRAQLIQLAQAGADATTAASQAAQGMQASVGNARANALAQGLGDIFGGTSALIQQQAQAAALRRQQQMPIGSIYGGR